MLGILSAGIAPGLALLSYFYLKDQYESEPFSMVFKTFIFGALLVFPIMFIQYVFQAEQIFQSNLVSAFLSTSLLEEFFKWFILLSVIYPHVTFDEPYDGIVYGASVSLGFATVENIFYLFTLGIEHAIGRALLPVSSHALFGVIMGYYIGKGKFSATNNRKWIFISLAAPFFLHGTYDYILITLKYWQYYMVPFMIFLWWLALRKAKKARILSGHFHQMKYERTFHQ
ncbi:protease PrsW [Cytobacillus horneckiae]|uniref:Protease PrsW n=1 Tax=Cytobacillus horneckiae TaxID=549687 RepID=A0A2N0ZCV9_9BACI|nr:glutamic-type intramembrane protease PrsW [Cytobacillus horneckiae]NRG43812.1 intramembrane metalloprotease PrsW [Bacillus sp. CRN 9]MBN6888398.1 intramembrane metalloprotease PrsW [Cytobacillus horneckiae]MCM3180125.1 glutamic-type intramembrane protease PrsW [Cytobacillus horneckiae]MEC1156562.1 glutamic-type intramembrane protease PrsW [Cytobacillus horneckiae]MED2938913.1 glutamic-type intramembrane protease PrsW [Cytobacillus horneckiae]